MKPQARPRSHAGDEGGGIGDRRGQRRERRPRRRPPPSAPIRNWPWRADVEEAGLEAEADGEAAEDERRRLRRGVGDDRSRLAERSPRAAPRRRVERQPQVDRRPSTSQARGRMITNAPTTSASTIDATGTATTAQIRAQAGRAARTAPRAVVDLGGSTMRPRVGLWLASAGRHQQADLLLVGGSARRRSPTISPRYITAIRSDSSSTSSSSAETSRTRRPGVALRDRLAVDELDAADVEAAGRLVEDEQLRGRG